MFYSGAFQFFLTLMLISRSGICQQPTEAAVMDLQWRVFIQRVLDLPHERVIPLEKLNQFSKDLLLSSKQFPAFDEYSWWDIKLLRALRQNRKSIDINNALHLPISIQMKAGPEQVCALNYGNLCVQIKLSENGFLKCLVAVLVLGMLSVGVFVFAQRRQESKERKFILQFLTHELRTPITSLGFTIECLRKNVDQLDEKARKNFGRLLADYQRLFMLAETSKGFLSLEPHTQFQMQTSYLSDWLDHILDKYQLPYVLDKDQELNLPFYWLGICLDNLLKNAQQHGRELISINVSTKDILRIEVLDHGKIPHFYRIIKRLKYRRKYENMGVSLLIVTRLIKKMGGRLIYQQKPSRCILELPL